MRGSVIVFLGLTVLCYIAASDAYSVRFAATEDGPEDGGKDKDVAEEVKPVEAAEKKSDDEAQARSDDAIEKSDEHKLAKRDLHSALRSLARRAYRRSAAAAAAAAARRRSESKYRANTDQHTRAVIIHFLNYTKKAVDKVIDTIIEIVKGMNVLSEEVKTEIIRILNIVKVKFDLMIERMVSQIENGLDITLVGTEPNPKGGETDGKPLEPLDDAPPHGDDHDDDSVGNPSSKTRFDDMQTRDDAQLAIIQEILDAPAGTKTRSNKMRQSVPSDVVVPDVNGLVYDVMARVSGKQQRMAEKND